MSPPGRYSYPSHRVLVSVILNKCGRYIYVMKKPGQNYFLSFDSDIHGQWISVSEDWETLTGQPTALALGHAWVSVAYTDDVPNLLDKWNKFVSEQEQFKEIFRHVKKDGTIGWMEIVACKKCVNQSCHISGVLFDITERATLESKNYRTLQAFSQAVILARTDKHGVITEVNDAFCQISKFSRQELIGKTHQVVNSGIHADEFFQNMWATIASGRNWRGEVCNRAKDGELYWVDTQIIPFVGSNGQIQEYLAIRYDITKAKMNEAFARALLESSPDIVVEIDNKHRVKYLNKRQDPLAEAILKTNDILALLSANDRPRVVEGIAGVGDNRVTQVPQIRFENDPLNREFLLSLAPIFQNSVHAGIMLEFTDVTKMVSLAKQVEEQRAMIFNRAKLSSLGQMAAGLSHEINNPLAIIQGNAERILSESARGTLSMDKVTDIALTIETTCDRISKIVKSLRSLGADDAEKATPDLVLVDRLINDTTFILQERSKAEGVEIKIDVEQSLQVYVEPFRVSQALHGLLLNSLDAIKAQPNKWVSISAHKVVSGEGLIVEISVKDSGESIPDFYRERLFEPFFTTKPTGQGMGLGLSMARSIVEANGGSIEFDAKSTNTCFKIRFPLYKKQKVA